VKKLTASLLVLTGAASFGVLSTILKLGYQRGFTTPEMTASEVLFGCVVLWLLSLPWLKVLRTLSFKAKGLLCLCGIFPGLTGILYYLALQTVSASLGVILLFQFVWMGILLDAIIKRRAPTRQQLLALALVLIGTVLAAGSQALALSSVSPIGILFGLLAAFCYTCNLQVNGRVATEVPASVRSTLMISGALVITLIIFPPGFLVDGSLGHGLWLWGLLMGLFGIVIPPFLFARGIPHIGPGLATILGSIELPVVITCSALVLHEPVLLSQWAGAALILIAIFFSEKRPAVQER
jgi:drug/metabolite transporter (DMT)-like permease